MIDKHDNQLTTVNDKESVLGNLMPFTQIQYNELRTLQEKKLFWDTFIHLSQKTNPGIEQDRQQILNLLKRRGLTPPNYQAVLDVISIEHVEALKLLLIFAFHVGYPTPILERAMETKNKEILTALQETGYFASYPPSYLSAKPFEQLKLLIEVFHWNIPNNSLAILDLDQKHELGLLYEKYLRRFTSIDPTRTNAMSANEISTAENTKNSYESCLSPLHYYCQLNPWDKNAKKIYQGMYGTNDQTRLDLAYLEGQLAALLTSDSSAANHLNEVGLLALINCYNSVAAVQKKSGPLNIHSNYVLKIQAEVRKLTDAIAALADSAESWKGLAYFLTLLMVPIFPLMIFFPPFGVLLPWVMGGAFMAAMNSDIASNSKKAKEGELSVLNNLHAIAEKETPSVPSAVGIHSLFSTGPAKSPVVNSTCAESEPLIPTFS